jgi:hypothetical protein
MFSGCHRINETLSLWNFPIYYRIIRFTFGTCTPALVRVARFFLNLNHFVLVNSDCLYFCHVQSSGASIKGVPTRLINWERVHLRMKSNCTSIRVTSFSSLHRRRRFAASIHVKIYHAVSEICSYLRAVSRKFCHDNSNILIYLDRTPAIRTFKVELTEQSNHPLNINTLWKQYMYLISYSLVGIAKIWKTYVYCDNEQSFNHSNWTCVGNWWFTCTR